MIRFVLIALLFVSPLLAWSQTEAPKKPVPAQAQYAEPPKKVGISSAARRSSLPAATQPVAKPNEGPNQSNQVGGNKAGNPGGMNPNRPNVRGVPKTRPGGPITRPGGIPGQRPLRPRLRPPGG